MNKKDILIFLGGALVGGLCTWFGVRDYYKKLTDEDVEDVRKYYDLALNEFKEAIENDKEMEKSVSVEVAPEDAKPEVRITRSAKPQAEVEPDYDEIIEKLNYNQYSTKVGSTLNKKPYIISMEEYVNDTSFDKVMCSYFADDEVLMNSETDVAFDDVGNTVGFDSLDSFGTNCDEHEVYVRNEKLGTDYHIILEEMSYADYLSDGDF